VISKNARDTVAFRISKIYIKFTLMVGYSNSQLQASLIIILYNPNTVIEGQEFIKKNS